MTNNYVKCLGDVQDRTREVVFFFDDTSPSDCQRVREESADYCARIVASGRRAPCRSVFRECVHLPFAEVGQWQPLSLLSPVRSNEAA